MFPTFCSPMGVAGWLLMLLLWGGLIALAVWGIARLFPDRAVPTGSPLPPQGTRVLALGHPRDLGLSVVEGTHNGAVQHAPVARLHYTGPINPGMSGGPAVTADGMLVGVNVATYGEEVAFLVPAGSVAALLARAPPVPPSAEGLRGDIARQLAELAHASLAGLFERGGPTAVMADFLVPTGTDSTFRCWGDTDRPREKRYEVLRHSCSMEATTVISETTSWATSLTRVTPSCASSGGSLRAAPHGEYPIRRLSTPAVCRTDAPRSSIGRPRAGGPASPHNPPYEPCRGRDRRDAKASAER